MANEDHLKNLEANGDYRVLRRLQPRSRYNAPEGTETKHAVFLDLEITGLDPAKDEIIELAMVPFEFSSDGRIFNVHEPYNALQEPKSGSVPAEITRITEAFSGRVGIPEESPARARFRLSTNLRLLSRKRLV